MTLFNDTISSSDLQIWDNAAFDCRDSVDAVKNSWSTLSSFKSGNKENLNTNFLRSPPSTELGLEQIDKEIESIEKEIDRLSCKLMELKRVRNARGGGRGGGVGLLEQNKKQSDENAERLKKLEDSLSFPLVGSMSHQRKGLAVGQSEIISAGPMTRRMIKQMDVSSLTPLTQNRKLCFWKLDQIDELKMTKERGKRFSLSPKSTKTIPTLPKQAATTVASKKTSSKVNLRVTTTSVLQPKKLFEEQVKKTAMKAGRIVGSKYNAGLRKRSLPENDESKGNEKKRASFEVKSSNNSVEQQQQCNRVKKKWEIPTKVVVFNSCISSNANDADDDNDDDQILQNLDVVKN